MTRALTPAWQSFFAGLVLVAAGAGVLYGGDQEQPLCVNGHPAVRRAHVTYGGLPERPGYVRDHIVPLCLGGSDTGNNMQYQTYADGHAKNALEWQACEDYCAGRLRAFFTEGTWKWIK